MADFDRFLPRLLRLEGGFVNRPDDPGGATNKGITLQTLNECGQELLGLAPTLDNLRALTDAQAGIVYKRRYWDPLRGDAIGSQALADMLVDFHVNAGRNAIVVLQRVLGEQAAKPPAVDGVFGDGTFAALAAADPTSLYIRLRAARIAYYTQLAVLRPSLDVFLKGWLSRVNSFPESP
jgi:lysozyme family protein